MVGNMMKTMVYGYIDKDHFLFLEVTPPSRPQKKTKVQILFLSQNGISHQLQS
jgi:hypothetical protein